MTWYFALKLKEQYSRYRWSIRQSYDPRTDLAKERFTSMNFVSSDDFWLNEALYNIFAYPIKFKVNERISSIPQMSWVIVEDDAEAVFLRLGSEGLFQYPFGIDDITPDPFEFAFVYENLDQNYVGKTLTAIETQIELYSNRQRLSRTLTSFQKQFRRMQNSLQPAKEYLSDDYAKAMNTVENLTDSEIKTLRKESAAITKQVKKDFIEFENWLINLAKIN